MRAKNHLLLEKFRDSATRGYERTIFRFAENLADITEKNMLDGCDFENSIAKSWDEAIKSSGIPTESDTQYKEMVTEAIEILFPIWEYGVQAKKWFKEFMDDFYL